MTPRTRGKTIVVVGAGGNIGSHLVPHLARTAGVGRVVLVDGEAYDAGNLWTQNIRRRDLEHGKVAVQKRVLREIDGTLSVEAITARVEDVPLARLRADVMLTALDSKAARRSVNTVVARLGIPAWIDAGVHGDALLARVSLYRPGFHEPCHECNWSDRDYALVEQRRPCAGGRAATLATNSPSSLGALAAALQALELRKLLAGTGDAAIGAREVVVGADAHRILVTTLTRNPRCRFDHGRWEIHALAGDVAVCSVGDAFERGRHALGSRAALALAVSGHHFARRLTCLDCDAVRDLSPYLFSRLGPIGSVCAACGGSQRVGGFDALDRLHVADLAPEVLTAPLTSLGLLAGDVITISDHQRSAHFECGGRS